MSGVEGGSGGVGDGDGGVGRSARLRLLFVCTANIARSPYAERRARQVLDGRDVEVASAGIPGYPGRAMDAEMARLLEARGGDAAGHVSQSVSAELLEWADLVLPFEFGQHMKLLEAFPASGGKILGLGQSATAVERWLEREGALPVARDAEQFSRLVRDLAGSNSMSYDIADPFRRGRRAAAVCADQIDRHLEQVLPQVAGGAVRKQAASGGDERKRRPWLSR